MAEGKQIIGAESECSIGLHNDSFLEPCSEAACIRQQLLMAISLLKHLAHNSPAAGVALTCAGVMDTIRRYACMSVRTQSRPFSVHTNMPLFTMQKQRVVELTRLELATF